MKATDIEINLANRNWYVEAMVGKLSYQERFTKKPNQAQIDSAVKSFEENYAGMKR